MMSSNRIQKPVKKKAFILLELLIAFSLVSFSIVPFIRYPLHQVKKETDFLFQMELERRANNILCNLHEKILRKEFSAEDIFIKKKILESKKDDDLEISFSEKMKRKYICKKIIKCTRSLTTKKNKQVALVTVTVGIYPKRAKTKKKERPILKAHREILVLRKVNINPTNEQENAP